MKRMYGYCGLLLVSLGAAAAAQAQSSPASKTKPALAVKMGLWQVTTTTQVGGQVPTIDTSRLTPEQKAQAEAMIKAMMGAHTRTSKVCMTEKKFAQSPFLDEADTGSSCKQTFKTNTRKTLESAVECKGGARSMTGEMHIDASSPESVKGTIKSSDTEEGRTITVDMSLSGKWLGADCKGID